MRKISAQRVIGTLVLLLFAALVLLPLFWLGVSAFKSDADVIKWPPIFFPTEWVTTQFAYVWKVLPIARMLLNTVVFAGGVTIISLFFDSMAAYAFGRIKFPGRNIIFGTLLAVLMVPSSFFILPQYLMIQKMGLLNTIPALFIPGLFSAFGTFLMRQFFMALPNELEDAARIDGCNHFMIFSRIMFPLVKPGLVALAILTLRSAWNDLMWPMIVNTSPEKMTLSAGLSYLQGQYATDYPVMMAGAVLAVLPLLILFALFQKQFIEGIALQGIKG